MNLNKKQTIAVLDQAQEMADAFNSVDGKVMHISVMYVGFWAWSSFDYMIKHGYDAKEEGCDYTQRFALTTTGEPIALPEYCYRLSRNPHVHVSLFYDFQKVTDVKMVKNITAGHIDPAVKGKEGFNELDFIDKEDSQRCLFFDWCNIDSLSNYFIS